MQDRLVVVVSPVPPPVHGAAIATKNLLAGSGCRGITYRHIDARFAGGMGDLGKWSLSKLTSLIGYLFEMLRAGQRRDTYAILLTPSWRLVAFFKDALFVWAASLFTQKKVIGWFHMRFGAIDYAHRPRLVRWFVRVTLGRIDYYVCLSDQLVVELPDFVDRAKVFVIPNGIQGFGGRRNTVSSRVQVLFLSNMSREKGWEKLLIVAHKLVERIEDVDFIFYGAPTMENGEDSLNRQFAAAEPRISYRGFVEGKDKVNAFENADIFCMPSLNEAFPLVILEAMSAGLPVVASKIGGVPDEIVDGQGGFLVEPGCLNALEDKLSILIEDRALRNDFGRFNKDRFSREFTVEKFQMKWAEILSAL